MSQFGLARTQMSTPANLTPKGVLSGSIVLFASQGNAQALDLSTEGVLDWFATVNGNSGAIAGSQPSKGSTFLSGSLRNGFKINAFGGVFGVQGSSGLTMHSDAADSTGNALAAIASFQGVGVGNNPTWLNWGFEIEAPASKLLSRNLNLYIGAINGTIGNAVTIKLNAHMSDESIPDVNLTQVQTDANEAVVNIYKANFNFRAGTPGAKLRVQCFVSGFTGSMQFVTIGLQCATLF